MNELKIQLDNRLQSLEISPALAARILTGTSPVKKRRLFRPLIVLSVCSYRYSSRIWPLEQGDLWFHDLG